MQVMSNHTLAAQSVLVHLSLYIYNAVTILEQTWCLPTHSLTTLFRFSPDEKDNPKLSFFANERLVQDELE